MSISSQLPHPSWTPLVLLGGRPALLGSFPIHFSKLTPGFSRFSPYWKRLGRLALLAIPSTSLRTLSPIRTAVKVHQTAEKFPDVHCHRGVVV
jgi:hypothetical protein